MGKLIDCVTLDWGRREVCDLRDALAELYLDKHSIGAVLAAKAGMRPRNVAFQAVATATWTTVLEQLSHGGRLRAFVEGVADDPDTKGYADKFQAALDADVAEPQGVSSHPASPPGNEDERLAKDIEKLVDAVTRKVQGMPAVAAVLAGRLGLDPAPGEAARSVAQALVHARTGKDVVMALNAADDDLKGDAARAEDRRALKALLWQVLPFATDWRAWVREGRAALAGGKTCFDVPLGTLTMAEVILAGIDCRACRYETDGKRGPAGSALIHKPAAAHAPFLDPTGQRLAEATVGLLAVELFDLSPDAPELKNHRRLRRDVDEKLQYHLEASGEEFLPRWLLLDDDRLSHLGERAGGDEDQRVAVAVEALGKELPHLRVLRMGEGLDGETNLALHVGRMWRRGGSGE